ncbi:hypothetical protein J6590_074276 [Homalodisca vitripennis]|nr:hypothetical protein J6590_074276 [Homalodisca vitripennis]
MQEGLRSSHSSQSDAYGGCWTCCKVHKTLTLGELLYLYERVMFREEVALGSTCQSKISCDS